MKLLIVVTILILVGINVQAMEQSACSVECMKGWNHCTNKGQKLDVCFQGLREGRLVEACNDEKSCHPTPICSNACEKIWTHCIEKGQEFQVCLQALRNGHLGEACNKEPSCLPRHPAE